MRLRISLLCAGVVSALACWENPARLTDAAVDGGWKFTDRDAATDGGHPDLADTGSDQDGGSLDAGSDAGTADGGAGSDGGCAAASRFAGVPADWVELRSPNCQCRYYAPGAGGALPEQTRWIPCSFASAPAGCRQIDDSNWRLLTQFPSSRLSLDPGTGEPVLPYLRWASNGTATWLVEAVDGPVQSAIMEGGRRTEATPMDCGIYSSAVRDGKYALSLRARNHDFLGMIGGSVGERAPSHVEWRNGTDIWYTTGTWLIRWTLGSIKALSWSDGEERTVFSSSVDPIGMLPDFALLAANGAVIAPLTGSNQSYIMSWNPVAGLKPLLRWDSAQGKGAANVGTDGSVLVWSYGEGRSPGGGYRDYAHYYLRTAPFTTDPAALEATARTVVEEVDGGLINDYESYVVGCGYAIRVAQAHATLIVVRLSDGATWVLPRLQSPTYWDYAVGATCADVFASTYDGTRSQIARIPIASLGNPTQ